MRASRAQWYSANVCTGENSHNRTTLACTMNEWGRSRWWTPRVLSTNTANTVIKACFCPRRGRDLFVCDKNIKTYAQNDSFCRTGHNSYARLHRDTSRDLFRRLIGKQMRRVHRRRAPRAAFSEISFFFLFLFFFNSRRPSRTRRLVNYIIYLLHHPRVGKKSLLIQCTR